MKTILFILLFASFTLLDVNAQTTETVSELTPVAPNIGKFTKNVPKPNYPVLRGYKVKFDVKVESISTSDGKKTLVVIIQPDTREIVFENIGGAETAKISFYGRITSKDEKIDGFFEERQTIITDIEDIANDTVKPVILRKVFELPNGKYQIGIIVRDIFSGVHGVKIVKFQISQTENTQK